jgi:gluconate 2-dehydrogenase gamma chain
MTQRFEPRRKFLRRVFAIVPASALTSAMVVTESACSASSPSDQKISSVDGYSPTYFTDDEWAFISAAVDQLIPSDQYGPGALETGVPEYIDRQMETPYGHGKLWYMHGPFHPEASPELGFQLSLTPRDVYRLGIEECNVWCVKRYGKGFADLDAKTQVILLEKLEAGEVELDTVPSKLLFHNLLQHAKEGYLADPMYGGNKDMAGWKMIGFPGARADFMDWVGQTGVKYPLGPVSILGEQS